MTIGFWELAHEAGRVALLEESGRQETYASLARLADRWAERLPPGPDRRLGFILMSNRIDMVAIYLGALRSGGHVPLLLESGLDKRLLAELVRVYQPDWVAAPTGATLPATFSEEFRSDDVALYTAPPSDTHQIHTELGLLLSTSGSTGSPKLVRLPYRALSANAESIVEYLDLRDDDRAVSTLPLAYSFGMSILNSHLQAGGSFLLTDHTVLSREFWALATTQSVTSLSGVPNTFEMLRRVGLETRGLGCLRTLTVAGGKLRDEFVREYEGMARRSGWRFFVMYGQTEAAPRMSYVPPDRLADKVGSIGVPVPGGELDVDGESGELIYRGRNVMFGYASTRAELSKGDECRGVLRTGDLGRRDSDRFFYVTGRLKRFIKLSGARVNLDEVESLLASQLDVPVACVGEDDAMELYIAADKPSDLEIRSHIRGIFGVAPTMIRVHRIETLPLLANGKIDYATLRQSVETAGSSQ